jgi:hypothetical protein
MKKTIAGIMALAVLVAASCENGLIGGSGEHTPVSVALASVQSAASDPVVNCPVETAHYHDGVCYAGHYNNDGCSHDHDGKALAANAACTVNDCTQTGAHQHSGQYYGGHHGGDGCNSGSGHHNGNGHE